VDVLKAIVDLINTSPDHRAWLDPYDNPVGFDMGVQIHIYGPVVEGLYPDAIVINETILKIGPHTFDLNDPKSIDRIEELFGCDENEEPQFDPIDTIARMMPGRLD